MVLKSFIRQLHLTCDMVFTHVTYAWRATGWAPLSETHSAIAWLLQSNKNLPTLVKQSTRFRKQPEDDDTNLVQAFYLKLVLDWKVDDACQNLVVKRLFERSLAKINQAEKDEVPELSKVNAKNQNTIPIMLSVFHLLLHILTT